MPDRLHPQAVVDTYREMHPGKLDDISDHAIVETLKELDPDIYNLIDPLLLGAEILETPKPRKPTPIPTPPAQPATLATSVVRTVPAIAGAIGGFALGGPPGSYAGGAAGAFAGEAGAQYLEKEIGTREDFSVPTMLFEGALGAVNPAARGATWAGRAALQGAYGAALGGGGQVGRSLIEEGGLPSLPDVAIATTVGTIAGAGLQAAAEGLASVWHGKRPSIDADGPTIGAAKSYLEEIAAHKVTLDQVGAIRGQVERAMEMGPSPPPPPPPAGLLPAGRGDPNAITAYPPGVNPNIELVGSMAPSPSRIIGGTDVGAVPPPPAAASGPTDLSPIPLEPAPGSTSLILSSQPPGPSVPRGMAEPGVQGELLPPARPDMRSATRQTGEIGGAPPSREEPHLPGITTPGHDRPYATGPNAGPRREPRQEAHAAPRPLRRQVRTGKKVSYETVESRLRAEDPGTYPPEVRRELATIAYELETFKHERIQGGIQPGMTEELVRNGTAANTSDAIAYLRQNKLTASGSIPGAPVYTEIMEAAKDSFPSNATRADMLKHIRAALLEGRGTGLTDAAAQVARRRLAERGVAGPARRFGRKTSILAQQGDEGDALIGWVDEAGMRTLPEQDLDEFTRTARESDTGELLAAYRLRQSGEIPEAVAPFYDAAAAELVRRGEIDPEQLGLRMEGPGGDRGPRIFDFEGTPEEGAPPLPKTFRAAMRERGRVERPTPGILPDDIEARLNAPPEQPSLPGAEGVRATETPTPELDVPFSLRPPPAKPRIAPRTGSLLTDLMREEGVLVFDIPAGDRQGLKKWLAQQEKEHGGETWFNRTEQAISEGDWDRAFKAAAGASARSYAKAYAAASSPAKRAAIEAAVRGTPLQEDIQTQIVAGARQRAGVGTAPRVTDFPPSPRVTQAGAARGKATLGPAGILNPGPRQRPLSSAAPALRAATLDKSVVRLLMENLESPEGLATIPGNTDTYLRLFRQVGEKIYRGQNLKLLRDAGVSIPPEELAQHWNATITDAGRTLNLLSQFARTHQEALSEAAAQMDFGGMLGRPGKYVGARGQIAPPPVQQATQELLEEIAERTSTYHANAMANDLQKRTTVGPLRAIHDASYAWMLSKWATAVRNYASFTGRYGVESLDHALAIPIARLMGDEPTAILSAELTKARGLQPVGRTGTSVNPLKGGWAEDLQGIYDFTIEGLNSLPEKDARRAVRLLLEVPEAAAHYLGTVSGEDLSAAYADVPVMRYLTNPKVQRFLTMFNRAQEFSARATVFDATMRAMLRAKGHDPSDLLQRPVSEIIQAVGGQSQFQDLLFTATAQSLEATFAGRASKDSLPGILIQGINNWWPAKLGIPFPRFNLSSAPRFLWDHSPAALIDLLRFPLDRAGITAHKGTVAGGRLYRGVRAQEIIRTDLPELQLKIGSAERAQGEALQELLGTQREWNVRQRQIKRLESRAQEGLPDTATALENARDLQSQLGKRRDLLKAQIQEQSQIVRGHKGQQKELLERVADATGINAPNYAQWMARGTVGTVGLLGAAWVVRAQEGAQGTRWYEYRVDRGEGQDPIILDFRPFAPFAQYLFVADVLQDLYANTDWSAARAQAGEEGYGPGGPLAWSNAVWNNYEGKYTAAELGIQFAQAFLSISRAAGTTLTLTDLLTQEGVPGPEAIARGLVGTIGQFLSRFTIPGQQISDIVGQFSPEEAKIRVPPKATMEDWERPLVGPLANVPFARQVIPERISQTTGQPVAAEYPLLRGLLGIGTTPRDFVVEEARRIGLPGQSVYIRETGNYAIDRLTAETYARHLKETLPEIFASDYYQELRTPARQRDYLQTVLPDIKAGALAEVLESVGQEEYEGATVRGEEARHRLRDQRMVEELYGEVEREMAPEEPEASEVPAPPPPPPF